MLNKTQKFYIIALTRGKCGIGSIITSVMNHIIKAIIDDCIPIVDLQHYDNMYFKQQRKYRDNAWEYFFRQPLQYGLQDVEKHKEYDVVISNNSHIAETEYDFYISDIPASIPYKNKRIDRIKAYYQKYLHFSDSMMQYAEKQFSQITKGLKEDEILGICLRGTDYTERQSIGEHIQPKIEDVMSHIKKIMKKYPKIKKIYLATEDNVIYTKFKQEYGDKLLENPQYMYNQSASEKTMLLGEIEVSRIDHHYHLAQEYLASLYLLSKLKYFIAGRCNGSALVWLINKNFEYAYIYNLGTYQAKQYSIRERIFSIKKQVGKRYKILSILGIRIKIKFKE